MFIYKVTSYTDMLNPYSDRSETKYKHFTTRKMALLYVRKMIRSHKGTDVKNEKDYYFTYWQDIIVDNIFNSFTIEKIKVHNG